MRRLVPAVMLLLAFACTKKDEAPPASPADVEALEVDAPLGLSWGMSYDQARIRLGSIVEIERESTDGPLRVVTAVGEYAGQAAEEISLKFVDDRLYRIFITLAADTDASASLRWFQLVSHMEKEHGEPDIFELPEPLREKVVATITRAQDEGSDVAPLRLALDLLLEADGRQLDALVASGHWEPRAAWTLPGNRSVDGRILPIDVGGEAPLLVGGLMFDDNGLADKAREVTAAAAR